MRKSALFLAALAIVNCTSKSVETAPPAPMSAWTPAANAVTVMTFNVENLFDTEDDKGKDDMTFLPLAVKSAPAHQKKCAKIEVEKWRNDCLQFDWNEEVLKLKLERLGRVIKSAKNGQGPDILVLQEVENKKVLQRLVDEHLKNEGYRVILLEGNDIRGIDVAIVSRLKTAGPPVLHQIPFKKIEEKRKRDTRGILQANFKLPDGRGLAVFAVHFPAPFHPYELRADAVNFLNRLKRRLPKGVLAVAAGDFNITREENESKNVVERFFDEHWLAAHKLGCKGCRGTNYYAPKDSWSFLDMILISKEFYDGTLDWKAVPASVRILNLGDPEQIDKGAPKEFDPAAKTGVSDHWPLAIDLVPK